MPRLIDDPLFQMCAERALLPATRGGAELGEIERTLTRVVPGDVGSWFDAWSATAATVEGWADRSALAGHPVSAREAYARAATYHRIAYAPLFGAPVDPRLVDAFDRQEHCFRRFAEYAAHPVRAVEIPYEDTTLPGFLCLPAGASGPLPTLVAVDGYDGSVHEMYWAHAVPAVRRGMACLLVDGPGQGRALVKQGLVMRPDWEHVLNAVFDAATGRPEVDGERIAVMGWSFGGYLAPRGVSGEPRAAALVADPGQWDLFDVFGPLLPIPEELRARLPEVAAAELDPYLSFFAEDPVLRWKFVQRALWVHGLRSVGEYVLETYRYRLSDRVAGITCPTLVVAAEGDPTGAAAGKLYEALECPKAFTRFAAEEGTGGHCETANRSRFDQRVFDWLEDVLRKGR
ncbi:alpha/beta hydrolase [Streptomyces solincola]|uniref:Alpha/beta hydrolase n=1 Tax=Streptomyces solincola TaxID=2100817 RepID=A0A2S9PUD6_9ACTN|nr:alpha/beta hydrolase family protein [Streptomyces solincola]PRH78032.1 alpha/beta hydrolase [Streptomyces solincola]